MYRIFQVADLAQKKKELRVKSEIHRQTLMLELTNLRIGLALVRKRMRVLRTVARVLGLAAPVGGLIFGRKEKGRKRGFLSNFLTGFSLASRLKALFGGVSTAEHDAEEPAARPEPRS